MGYADQMRFARQQWRAWIETPTQSARGLTASRFARQQWRAWIETSSRLWAEVGCLGFARQQWRAWIETRELAQAFVDAGGSPASNGGRGLKLLPKRTGQFAAVVRPPAMAGVD